MKPASVRPSPRSGMCGVCGCPVVLHFATDDDRFVSCAGAREQLLQAAARIGECGLAVVHIDHRSGNRGSQIVR